MQTMVTHREPESDPVAAVFDSPHSGTYYPEDFRFSVPMSVLRATEDTYVHELFGAAPGLGAHLIAAEFPRSYIDPNRSLDDIDETLLDGPWPDPVAMSHKATMGSGLIRRSIGNDQIPVYDRKLSVAEVQARIENCWQPYHDTLDRLLAATRARFGAYWHVNCHSMNSVWGPVTEKAGQIVADDFILGNRDGTTAGPEFTELVRETLIAKGYKVALNDQFKGVALVQRHGKPAENCHSLQIEINRGRYMNETTYERSGGFTQIRDDLTDLVRTIRDYARDQAPIS